MSNANCCFIILAHLKQFLTHSLECGVSVEILDGRLLFIWAGDLSHGWIWLRYHSRCLSHVVHVVAI